MIDKLICNNKSRLSALDWLVVLYLTLPLLIFCFWFKFPYVFAFLIMAIFGLYKNLQNTDACRFDVSGPMLCFSFFAAGLWVSIAGVGHFFYANADWLTRDAVLRDLASTEWPPRYVSDGPYALILRAPVAYYLPAALVGKVLGLGFADFFLYLWTVVGFGLFLSAAVTLFPLGKQRWVAILVLVGFGGMDLIGYVGVNGALPRLGQHLEWWANFAQYSSNSTLLFWVPNHALPSWLGVVLVLRHWRSAELSKLAPVLAATIPLWSPLAAVGLAPFIMMGVNWRRDYRNLISIQSSLPWLGLALIVARYITLDAQGIPSRWAFYDFVGIIDFLKSYFIFVGVEFGLLVFVLFRMKAFDVQLWIAVMILLALPLYRFGLANDFVMRSSIPALTVVALATVRPLTSLNNRFWHGVLLAVMIIGAMGSAQEPLRAFLTPRWALKGLSLQEVMNHEYGGSIPPHYAARLNQPGLIQLMREPTLVRSSQQSPAGALP
ncbi:MAG: hypothetical protein V4532_09005 [Pseudomonadota bacterium]